jgi:hypothetical protein
MGQAHGLIGAFQSDLVRCVGKLNLRHRIVGAQRLGRFSHEGTKDKGRHEGQFSIFVPYLLLRAFV